MPFVHWLPRGLGCQLVKLGPWRLLSRPSAATINAYWWGTQLPGQREIKALFPNATLKAERMFGLIKSYDAIETNSR